MEGYFHLFTPLEHHRLLSTVIINLVRDRKRFNKLSWLAEHDLVNVSMISNGVKLLMGV